MRQKTASYAIFIDKSNVDIYNKFIQLVESLCLKSTIPVFRKQFGISHQVSAKYKFLLGANVVRVIIGRIKHESNKI